MAHKNEPPALTFYFQAFLISSLLSFVFSDGFISSGLYFWKTRE